MIRLGEVIEASTTELVAESYALHQAPCFGSMVWAQEGDIAIYGITAGAKTGSIDPGRRPIARGRDEASEDGIYRNNPELSELLRTEFTAVVIGFREGGIIRQYLPPRPPRIHSFVYQCSPAEVREFGGRLDFLATLVGLGQRGTTDELVAACLRQMGIAYGSGEADRAYLVRAGKELASLLGGEVSRLNGILRRMRA
jgi:hypothetical protein